MEQASQFRWWMCTQKNWRMGYVYLPFLYSRTLDSYSKIALLLLKVVEQAHISVHLEHQQGSDTGPHLNVQITLLIVSHAENKHNNRWPAWWHVVPCWTSPKNPWQSSECCILACVLTPNRKKNCHWCVHVYEATVVCRVDPPKDLGDYTTVDLTAQPCTCCTVNQPQVFQASPVTKAHFVSLPLDVGISLRPSGTPPSIPEQRGLLYYTGLNTWGWKKENTSSWLN